LQYFNSNQFVFTSGKLCFGFVLNLGAQAQFEQMHLIS